MLSPYILSMRAHAWAPSFIVTDDAGLVIELTYLPAHAASSRLKWPSVPAQTIAMSVSDLAAVRSIAETTDRFTYEAITMSRAPWMPSSARVPFVVLISTVHPLTAFEVNSSGELPRSNPGIGSIL